MKLHEQQPGVVDNKDRDCVAVRVSAEKKDEAVHVEPEEEEFACGDLNEDEAEGRKDHGRETRAREEEKNRQHDFEDIGEIGRDDGEGSGESVRAFTDGAGADVVFDRLPYFYTDQYDVGMEYTGHAPPGGYDTVVVRGDPAKREFVAFWTCAGRVVAGMSVNVWDVTAGIENLIRSRARVDPARLADPDVPLDALLARL